MAPFLLEERDFIKVSGWK